jgi:hypothetical protein
MFTFFIVPTVHGENTRWRGMNLVMNGVGIGIKSNLLKDLG